MIGKKPDTYLTEMKELPPSYPSEEKKGKESEERKEVTVKVRNEVIKKEDNSPKEAEKKIIPTQKEPERVDIKDQESIGEKIVKKERSFTYKDVILGVVNFISVIFFVVIITNFPKKSLELKNLRIQKIKNETAAGLGTTEIETAKPKADTLNKLFLDEAGIVNFVNDVELQKVEGGAISKVSFASQKAVSDKTSNFGVPIVIELAGSWEAIDNDLQKIDKLPYLFRPVKVEIGYDEENPGVVVYKYGIFLYVRENLGKTR